jgi:hypothetical protein
MRGIMKLKLSLFFVVSNAIASNVITNDAQAFLYCQQQKQSFIVVLWPLAQGRDGEIEKLLNTYGSIKYKSNRVLNYNDAKLLLRKAHPHVKDMDEHVRWYFPGDSFSKPARVYVWKCSNLETALKCKHAIRKLFHLQYRSIHVNDTYTETLDLARFFYLGQRSALRVVKRTGFAGYVDEFLVSANILIHHLFKNG